MRLVNSTLHLFKRNYAAEFARALRALVSAADMITTIRLDQSSRYNSPTVYGRTLTHLFDALLGVTFAPSVETTLEIHDCPRMNLRECGLFLDEKVIMKVAVKFSRISLETQFWQYPIGYPSIQLAQQLVDGMRASGDHLTGLFLRGAPFWTPKPLVVSEYNYPSLTHIALSSIWVSSPMFVPFVSNKLPQLISLHASYIYFDGGELEWREAFDVWRAVKKSLREQGTYLKLKHLTLATLYDYRSPTLSLLVDSSAISTFVKNMLPVVNVGYRDFR